MADASVKQQIIDKIKDSNNILVTVNTNPSVDELSAALGITLLINKMNKHATAVFSGAVPPAIEFLEPQKTFENTVDSLRDFIIALDKEKADHLRYKVVDDMVKIFITPYRTTISEKDLDFSQGDYNVEFVLAIGVKSEADLDKALESHGRILHDATVATISMGEETKLGGIEWADKNSSSYSEMLVDLANGLKTDKNLIDEQISTAFLTGIVAATERFSNSKTSAAVMTLAAQLMAAGANQQLIATKLEQGSAYTSKSPSDANLQEGESAKIDRGAAPSSEKPVAAEDGAGALAISHMPEGTIEQVSEEVATEKSNDAVNRAEAEIAKRTEEVVVARQVDATTEAERELADGLASVPTPQPAAFHGPVSAEQWQQPNNIAMAPQVLDSVPVASVAQPPTPVFPGTADSGDKTILTHEGSPYVTGEPTFQSSINATNDPRNKEERVPDVLAGEGDRPLDHAAAIQPPAPVQSVPTLAEIDAQNRVHQEHAMAAVNAALDTNPAVPQSSPAAAPLPPIVGSLPPLPPAPPLPDFSTLPPLPAAAPAGPLGDMLPPLGSQPLQPTTASPADPGQFRIPGQ